MTYSETKQDILSATEDYVKETLAGAEAGHDWYHIARVRRLAKEIHQQENGNWFIIELGVLLHDIADAKFHGGDDNVGPRVADSFLRDISVDDNVREQVVYIIENVSWKGGGGAVKSPSKELQIVQDADRIDALGAIGIARVFSYGGYKGQPMYDPEIPVKMNMSKKEYRKGNTTSLNHFYEKLFLLPDHLHTKTARQIASGRVDYMKEFVSRFKEEWCV